jgi:uncharacterized protein
MNPEWIAWLLPAGMDLDGYVLMGLLVMAGACMQGIGGIGFSMLSAPIALFAYAAMVPGPLLLLGGLVSVMAALRDRPSIQWRIALDCTLGRTLGAALATVAMVVFTPRLLGTAFGLLLLAGAALSAAGWKVAANRRNAWIAGLLSGLMGTITSAGAPPLGLLTQRLAPPAIRATIGCVIALGSVISLLMLSLAGQFSVQQLLLGVALFPWVMAGFAASGRISRYVSAALMRRLLLMLVTASALMILARVWLG